MFKKYFLIYIISIAIPIKGLGQKFISDSLVVGFGTDNLKKIDATIDTIIDKRNLKPNCINISERSKYYNIPIDYFILTSKPLSSEISGMFLKKNDSLISKKFSLEIKEFNITGKSQLFKSNYTCNSIISVYSVDSNRKVYNGTLVYEIQNAVKKNKKQPEKEYEEFIDYWKSDFARDMNDIASHPVHDSTFKLPNLIQVKSGFRKNMIASTDVAFGKDSWLIDGEIMFSQPEPQSIFYRQGNIIRYRHETKFESLEFLIINKQFNYRINDRFVFMMKEKLFWGLNDWSNNEYSKHGIQDIIILDLSLSQSIVYNPFYKRGIICGVGILEDVTEIYSIGGKFKPYIMVQLGIKL